MLIGVELVNVIFVIFVFVVRVCLVFVLNLLMMFSIFGGSRFWISLVNNKIDIGVCFVGFSIIMLLVISVGVSFYVVISSGKFYGMICLIIL